MKSNTLREGEEVSAYCVCAHVNTRVAFKNLDGIQRLDHGYYTVLANVHGGFLKPHLKMETGSFRSLHSRHGKLPYNPL